MKLLMSLIKLILMAPSYIIYTIFSWTNAIVKTIFLCIRTGCNRKKMYVEYIKEKIKQQEEVLTLIEKTTISGGRNEVNERAKQVVLAEIENFKSRLVILNQQIGEPEKE